MTDKYWVRLSHAGRPLGGGMVIQRGGVVLTAAHCLRSVPHGEHVEVAYATGRQSRARIEEVADWDIALVVAVDPEACDVAPPTTDICRPKDPWTAPYRPSNSDPQLSGSIVAERCQYHLHDGTEVNAIQLDVDQVLGDYSGYSGGPVERTDSGEQRLVGILLEQHLDRQLPDRASNVLFAATIREALLRFRRFEYSHLFPELKLGPTRAAVTASATTGADAIADARLRLLRQWRHEQLISPPLAPTIEIRILEEWLRPELDEDR